MRLIVRRENGNLGVFASKDASSRFPSRRDDHARIRFACLLCCWFFDSLESVRMGRLNFEAIASLPQPNCAAMSETKVRGIVHVVEETKTYGQKGFRKRLVVLEQDTGRFTNYIPVEFLRDNCELADDLNVGDDVEVSYQLSGRKWQKDPNSEVKYFLTAEALSFKVMAGGGEGAEPPADANDAFAESNYDENDIPF